MDVDRLDALAADRDGEARRRLLGARRIEQAATAEGDTRAGGLEEASPVDHFSPLGFLGLDFFGRLGWPHRAFGQARSLAHGVGRRDRVLRYAAGAAARQQCTPVLALRA